MGFVIDFYCVKFPQFVNIMYDLNYFIDIALHWEEKNHHTNKYEKKN